MLEGVLEGVIVGALGDVWVGVLAGVLVGRRVGISDIEPVDELTVDFSPRAIGQAVNDNLQGGVAPGMMFFVLFGAGPYYLWPGGSGRRSAANYLRDGLLIALLLVVQFVVLVGMLALMLVGVLFSVLFEVLPVLISPLQSKRRNQPNQGIRRSAVNAPRGGLLFGLLFGLTVGVLFGVTVGVLVGILVGVLRYGGEAVIKHYLLRLLLRLNRLLPLRLIPFMEAMSERILVQRAGAHYRFIHRTFQEHVAALSDERIAALTMDHNP